MRVEIDDGTRLRKVNEGLFQGFRTQAYEIEGKQDLKMVRQMVSVRFKGGKVHLRISEGHRLIQNGFVDFDEENKRFRDTNGNYYMCS